MSKFKSGDRARVTAVFSPGLCPYKVGEVITLVDPWYRPDAIECYWSVDGWFVELETASPPEAPSPLPDFITKGVTQSNGFSVDQAVRLTAEGGYPLRKRKPVGTEARVLAFYSGASQDDCAWVKGENGDEFGVALKSLEPTDSTRRSAPVGPGEWVPKVGDRVEGNGSGNGDLLRGTFVRMDHWIDAPAAVISDDRGAELYVRRESLRPLLAPLPQGEQQPQGAGGLSATAANAVLDHAFGKPTPDSLAARFPESHGSRCAFCSDLFNSHPAVEREIGMVHEHCRDLLARRAEARFQEKRGFYDGTALDPYTLDKTGAKKDEARIFAAMSAQPVAGGSELDRGGEGHPSAWPEGAWMDAPDGEL